MYRIGLSCLFFQMYFLHIFGSCLMLSSAIVPSSSMWTSWSISACNKAPAMSDKAMCLPSLALIVHGNIIASSDKVGELVSFFSHVNYLWPTIGTSSCLDNAITFFFQEHQVLQCFLPCIVSHIFSHTSIVEEVSKYNTSSWMCNWNALENTWKL